jgi:hypothetical protein
MMDAEALRSAVEHAGLAAAGVGLLAGLAFSFNPVALASIPVSLTYVTKGRDKGQALIFGSSQGRDGLRRTGHRQLSFVFADSPKGGGETGASDVSDGRGFLLHTAKRKRKARTVACTADSSRLLEDVASVANLAQAPWSSRYQPTVWPMKVATNAPAIPSTVVSMKPFGSFGPGETNRAIRPAMKPIKIIQKMFNMTFSVERAAVEFTTHSHEQKFLNA